LLLGQELGIEDYNGFHGWDEPLCAANGWSMQLMDEALPAGRLCCNPTLQRRKATLPSLRRGSCGALAVARLAATISHFCHTWLRQQEATSSSTASVARMSEKLARLILTRKPFYASVRDASDRFMVLCRYRSLLAQALSAADVCTFRNFENGSQGNPRRQITSLIRRDVQEDAFAGMCGGQQCWLSRYMNSDFLPSAYLTDGSGWFAGGITKRRPWKEECIAGLSNQTTGDDGAVG
jgi:hypothetical protein